MLKLLIVKTTTRARMHALGLLCGTYVPNWWLKPSRSKSKPEYGTRETRGSSAYRKNPFFSLVLGAHSAPRELQKDAPQ